MNGKLLLLTILLGSALAAAESVAELIVFSDDFNRIDAATLGGAWDDLQGAPQGFGVESNAATVVWDKGNPSGPGFALMAGVSIPATSFSIDVDMDHTAASGVHFGSIVFGFEDTSNYWELRLRGNSGDIFLADLIQTSGGVELATTSTWDFAAVESGFLHLDVDYDGTVLRVTVNNPGGFNPSPPPGTATQANVAVVAEGQVGFKSRAGERIYAWDNFQVAYETIAIGQVGVGDAQGLAFSSVSGTTYRLEAAAVTASNDFTSTGGRVADGPNTVLFDPAGFSTSKIYRVISVP